VADDLRLDPTVADALYSSRRLLRGAPARPVGRRTP